MYGEKNHIIHLNCDFLNLWTKSYGVTIQRRPLLAKCNNYYFLQNGVIFFVVFEFFASTWSGVE